MTYYFKYSSIWYHILLNSIWYHSCKSMKSYLWYHMSELWYHQFIVPNLWFHIHDFTHHWGATFQIMMRSRFPIGTCHKPTRQKQSHKSRQWETIQKKREKYFRFTGWGNPRVISPMGFSHKLWKFLEWCHPWDFPISFGNALSDVTHGISLASPLWFKTEIN